MIGGFAGKVGKANGSAVLIDGKRSGVLPSNRTLEVTKATVVPEKPALVAVAGNGGQPDDLAPVVEIVGECACSPEIAQINHTVGTIPNERSSGDAGWADSRSGANVGIANYLPALVDCPCLGIGSGTERSQILHSVLRIPDERPQLVVVRDIRPEVLI